MRNVPPCLLALSTFVLLAATTADLAHAQEVTATPSGELMVRFRHIEGHNFAPGGVDNFMRQRARLGLRFAYGDEVQALVQVQDVRTWGEESDTLGDFSANGFDLHQGYLELAVDSDLRLRIGRQEIQLLNQRLIGNVGFVEQGRSFDAVRLMARAFDQQLSIDVFYARTLDALPVASQAADDLFAYALKLQLGDYFQPALIGVLDLSSGTDRVRMTQGVVLQSEFPFGLRFGIEGYVQAGSATVEAADVGYLAWMFATRLRFTLVDSDAAPFLEAFVETLSGDDDPSDSNEHVFDTLFATNHKFYGEGDFFLNIPADTAKRGLLDAGAMLGAKLGEDGFGQLAFHIFQTMAGRGGATSYGQEIDLTVGVKLNPHLALDFNYSLFIPGAALVADGNVEHFIYSTASASF